MEQSDSCPIPVESGTKEPTSDAITVGKDLEAWRNELYSDETNGGVCRAFLFSAEWDALIGPRLKTYDALLQRQQTSSAPRLPWQDEEETSLMDTANLRRESLRPLNERLLPKFPIWLHLAIHQGFELSDTSRRVFGWESLLDDWHEIRRLVKEDQTFAESLSPTHKRSISLLHSWWDSEYCEPSLVKAAVTHLEKRKADKSLKNPLFPSDRLAHAAETRIDSSLYHSCMYQLFLYELHPKCWEPNIHVLVLIALDAARYNASVQAVIQKLSYASIYPGQYRIPEPYPIVAHGDSIHQHLDPARKSQRGPRYLWDADQSRTIEVSGLTNCPPYTCISHTWGRWRPRPRTSTAVTGVPWLVLENTLYDVRDLPDQLRRLGSRFIWMDLFCIPQDRSEIAAREIANQAFIFRGSASCIAWLHDVDDWEGLHSVLDWIVLRCLTIISRRNQDISTERLSAAAVSATAKTGGLYKTKSGMSTVTAVEPSAWFSSLWTLQESVLCPDMALYTKSWVRLTDKRNATISLQGLMVFMEYTMACCWVREPFDTTLAEPTAWNMALRRHPYKMAWDKPDAWDYPPSVRDMFLFSAMTRLARTLTTGLPSNIFINADIRTCTSDRAPAIMSALGVTDWYLESLGQAEAPALVFGKYPLAFLREAARKMGAKFYDFCSSLLIRSEAESVDPQEVTRAGADDGFPKATMLPISDNMGWYNGIKGGSEGFNIDMQDHESVATWTINQTGSVSMSQVGILLNVTDSAVESDARTCEISALVSYVTTDKSANGLPRSGSTRTTDMLGVLKRLRYAGRDIFAIALYRDAGLTYGLLLEAESTSSTSGERTMRKFGRFMAYCSKLPPSTKVIWVAY